MSYNKIVKKWNLPITEYCQRKKFKVRRIKQHLQDASGIWIQINGCFQTGTDTRLEIEHFVHFNVVYRWLHTQWMTTFIEATASRSNCLYTLPKLTAGNNKMSVGNVCHSVQNDCHESWTVLCGLLLESISITSHT